MIKAIKEIRNVPVDLIFPYTQKFLERMKSDDKTIIIEKFINECLQVLDDGTNFPILIALNTACIDYYSMIDKSRLLNILTEKRIKNFFQSHPNMTLRYLILNIHDINVYRYYLKYSNDISILSLPHFKRENVSKEWVDTVINILDDKSSLRILFEKIIDGFTPWLYLGINTHYRKISKSENKIFISLLKTIKQNWDEFKDINIPNNSWLEITSQTPAFYKMIFNLMKLIKYQQNNEIKKLEDMEYVGSEGDKIMWYSDTPQDVIQLMNEREEYKSGYIADKLYICTSSELRKQFKQISPIARSVDIDYYIETGHFKNRSANELLDKVLNEEIDFWDLKYYIQYLNIIGVSAQNIIDEMLKNKDKANFRYGDILYFLFDENKEVAVSAFIKSNYLFNSTNFIRKIDYIINEENLELFIKSFHKFTIDFRKKYSYSEIINSFEGKCLEVIVKLFTHKRVFDKIKLPNALKKMITNHPGFNAIIDSYLYRLINNFKLQNNNIKNLDYIYTFMENSMWSFTVEWTKICTKEYLDMFIKYLCIDKVIESDTWTNHILWYIHNLHWEDLEIIINLLPENALINQYHILSLNYKLKEIPSYKEFTNTKLYTNIIKSFATWLSHIWGYSESEMESYDIEIAKDFWKTNFADIEFYPYNFHHTIHFLKDNNFSRQEIYNICLSIRAPSPGEIIRGIPNPYEDFNGIEYIRSIFSDEEYKNFMNVLSSKGITMTSILIK